MTALPSEIERFDRLAATWWDPRGPMRPLHEINDLRLAHVLARAAGHFGARGDAPMAGLRVLDVGCGGGLLSEPLARQGARVVGIDASPGNLAAACRHAMAHRVAVDYRLGDPAQALATHERFDLVLALEVVEHVDDMPRFVGEVARHVAPGGLLMASTIDRTWKSFVVAIVGAEHVLRLLPRGTHQWRRFVRPAELARAAQGAGLVPLELRGLRYSPWRRRADWCRDTRVNYLATFTRP